MQAPAATASRKSVRALLNQSVDNALSDLLIVSEDMANATAYIGKAKYLRLRNIFHAAAQRLMLACDEVNNYDTRND